MFSGPRAWSLAALCGAALVVVPSVRADDIVPTSRIVTMRPLSFDTATGMLHGNAGAGTVTVMILGGSRPRRTRLRAFPASDPMFAIAEEWNATTNTPAHRPGSPSDPYRAGWGDIPTSPFSVLLGRAIAAGGSVKVRLFSDLVGARIVRLVP